MENPTTNTGSDPHDATSVAVTDAGSGTPADEAATDRDVMMRVCSLGNNCEVGFAQRAYAAEPVDLFRWANTRIAMLLTMIEKDFENIEDIKVTLHGNQYAVIHEGYNFLWHAFVGPDKMAAEDVAKREKQRLPFLVRKFREDVAEGHRLFVMKHGNVQTQPFTLPLMLRVRESLGRYGNPTILFVNDGAPINAVKAADRIIVGTIPQFALGSAVPKTTKSDDWLALSRSALALM